MSVILKACPRCEGAIIDGLGPDLQCMTCGWAGPTITDAPKPQRAHVLPSNPRGIRWTCKQEVRTYGYGEKKRYTTVIITLRYQIRETQVKIPRAYVLDLEGWPDFWSPEYAKMVQSLADLFYKTTGYQLWGLRPAIRAVSNRQKAAS